MIPTIEQVEKLYPRIAETERMKTGGPSATTVGNVLVGVRRFCQAAHLPSASPVTALTRQAIDRALGEFTRSGLKRISAKSYMDSVRALFARWSRPYYRDEGWDVPVPELPRMRVRLARYQRPSSELLGKVKAWYAGLTGEWWFAATMMLEFAMRNGDVLRLKDENFVTERQKAASEGRTIRHYLSYTPHKTELSSGRRVYWSIHDDIWAKFDDYGGMSGLDVTDETFSDLNRELRALGFKGSKASYELRKICIDHVYQKFGAELAVSLSGDDIRTISRFYADPAQPAVGAVRIVDLL